MSCGNGYDFVQFQLANLHFICFTHPRVLVCHFALDIDPIKVWYPVRTALGAACLLRRMADAYERVDPLTCDEMRKNADFFEVHPVLIFHSFCRSLQHS